MNEEKNNKFYKQKVIKSGRMLEIYTYEQTQLKPNVIAPSSLDKSKKEVDKERERSNEYKNRAKQNFRRLVEGNSNIHPEKDKFLTLTFAENIQDREWALAEFRKFIYKARRKFKAFEYIAVIEHQERGAIHFHCFLFGFPYFPKRDLQKITKLWRHGRINIQAIKDHFKLTNYLMKYFLKTFDEHRNENERRYFASKGLKRPEQTVLDNFVDFDKLGHELFSVDFESPFTGKGNYKKIRLYNKNNNLSIEAPEK